MISVAFSPDGTQIVPGSRDRTLTVWRVSRRETSLTLRGHDDGVLSVVFSPDGTRIVSGSRDHTLKVWETKRPPAGELAARRAVEAADGVVAALLYKEGLLLHELVRHRAGFGYSQLSQRNVDESVADFVEPGCIAADAELHEVWLAAVEECRAAYVKLVDGLLRRFADQPDKTLRRKLARQAARSVLPNATETKIFVTANARALRHLIEMRASEHAETEIRIVAAMMLERLQEAAPNIFGDYELIDLPDGTQAARGKHRKV